ncbi:MAG: SRPBCC domain-containing protein [Solirubrobacterales bacterium]|nr:SRPBCC domain-containing protein [Solirubrobacterales bacterium]
MTDELHYERIVAAPRDDVFDAFTSAGGQLAFYGQDDPGWIVRSESDLRVGGVWTILFGPSSERLYRHRHVFEVIDRPRRLVLSTTETRLDGSNLSYQTEVTFEPSDRGTLITMTQRGIPTDELRAEHARGIPNAFDRLEQLLPSSHG